MTNTLLQQALDALEWAGDLTQVAVDHKPLHAAINAIRAALDAPQPEPVAVITGESIDLREYLHDVRWIGDVKLGDKLYAAAPVHSTTERNHMSKELIPVCWMTENDGQQMYWPTHKEASAYCDDGEEPTPLYAAPAAPSQEAKHPCSTHPDAPHGFNRNASHSNQRYVCDCEGWSPTPALHAVTLEEAFVDVGIRTSETDGKIDNFLSMVRLWIERDSGDMEAALEWMYGGHAQPVVWRRSDTSANVGWTYYDDEPRAYQIKEAESVGDWFEPLYAAAQPYDQTALELCGTCGWKTLIPGEGCLNCERDQKETK